MISAEAAIQEILRNTPVLDTELVPVDRCAGRILRQPVLAGRDAPPFDRVMMDGYAVASASLPSANWQISGIALAGHEPPACEDPETCIEVTTGCILPDGCDTVIPVEDCLVTEDAMRLREGVSVNGGQFIHARGSDNREGDCILAAGARIGPPELAILATEGIAEVEVARQPRIGLITTGDEVVTDGSVPGRTQIRGSHFETLQGLFRSFPGLPFVHRHCRDDRDDLRDAFSVYLDCCDILLVTGGVSKGRKDFVPELLQELGVTNVLHRVAQRPGKPLWFGTMGSKLVFGLPGNPISSLICSRRYVFPVIERMMDANPVPAIRVELKNTIDQLDGMTWFVPVCHGEEGFMAKTFATSGSLQNLAGTSGFVEVPPAGLPSPAFTYYPWNNR